MDYGINWNNLDLKSEYQRNLPILNSYDIETLLLEIHCNIPKEKITKEKILNHFEEILEANIEEARSIIKSNIDNILKEAKK